MGPSTAMAPPMVISRASAFRITITIAASIATRASPSCTALRSRRGTNASTRIPTRAAPSMIRIGASAA